MESDPKEQPSVLSTDKYTIELGKGSSAVYKFDEEGNKIWLCSASDPQCAMDIIEGLILVEHKRFYYPEATPVISTTHSVKPPFMKKN